jgi:protein TonB
MIVEPIPRARSRFFQAVLGGSAIVQGLLLFAFVTLIGAEPETRRAVVDLIINEVKPPEPEPPKPEPPKPKPPPPPNKEVKEPTEPAKPIFGVTEESTTKGDSSMSVRVGNTVMKEPEKEFTDPSLVKPYSAPPPKVYEAFELDREPRPTKMVEPEYPPLARRTGKVGRVILRIQITKRGEVAQVRVLQGPGEDLGFEAAAVAAVKQWRFSVPTVKGSPVDVWADLPIRFTLD